MLNTLNKFFERHSFKVILVVLFMLPVLARGARKALMSNDNDVHDWLPTTYDETQDFAWFQQHFDNETFVLVSWDGCTLEDERLELFARKVIPPEEKADGKTTPLSQGPPPQKSWDDDFIWSGWFTKPQKIDLRSSGPLFKHVDTGQRLIERLTQAPILLSEEQALARLKGLFIGPDHGKPFEKRQTCAVITLTEAGKKDLRVTLNELYRIATEELGLQRERVRMGGPPVDNVAISVEGEKTLMRLFIPAGIVGVCLAFWCLRSVRLTVMVFSTALYAGAISLATVHYSGGTMNAILLTMPAVVYVAGISGAIHFANYYRDSVAEHGVASAPARALMHAALPCTLSAVTTSAGLASLYTSELMPIKMFGVYSAAGVISTLGLLFIFLPAWMQLWPMKPHSLLDGDQPKSEDIALPARWRSILQGVLDHYRLVFVVLLLLMVAGSFGLARINTSIKLTKLFSPSAPIIHDYTWLESELGPLVPMEVIVRVDNSRAKMTMLEKMELIDRIQKQMVDIPDIGCTMSATTFAPLLKVERKGVFYNKSVARNVLNKKLEDHREEYLHSDFLDLDEDGTELWRISARVGALNDVDYGVFKDTIRARVEPVLKAERQRLAAAHAKADAKAAKAAAENTDAEPAADAAAVAAAASPKKAAEPADQIAAAKPATASSPTDMGVSAVYTGLVPVVYKAQREMLNGLAWNFITDLLTIGTVMALVFWDLSAGLILLLPSVFPIVMVFGIMGWMGVVIDVGTIMTPTVALGVSVDDVVHFLIWYRRGLSEGRNRKGATMLSYEGCARAMYQSWSVLGLGLAVFALSSFVPTQRFGAMMFLLLTCALIGNILLLPSVLVSPISYFFGRRLMRRAAAEKLSAPASEVVDGQPTAHRPAVRRDGAHRARQAG
ncbi:MAG: RND family transporter [Pirellulales bacterium]